MRAEREQRRAKDAEFEHLRQLRAGACTDGAILRQLQHDKQLQQSFDLRSAMDGTVVVAENGSFGTAVPEPANQRQFKSRDELSPATNASQSPPRFSTSPSSPFSPSGRYTADARVGGGNDSTASSLAVRSQEQSSKSRTKVQLRPDQDRAADDLLRLDREAERYAVHLNSFHASVYAHLHVVVRAGCRKESKRRLAGLMDLIS